jgi:rhamnosyltransferase
MILSETRIIVPVLNGGSRWREAAAALKGSTPDPSMIAVIDSGSTDGSDAVAMQNDFELHRIEPRSFNHGRTRQEAIERFGKGKRFAIFLTQDAVVESPNTLTRLLDSFTDPRVGAAYGRQLPHNDAKPFEAHAALFNYQPASEMRSLEDARRLGIKAAFFSNSFGAYRISALVECGGFPEHLILGEDAYAAMRMLMSGWRVRYCAEALVRHSHAYSIAEEMRRYFDFGVMHAQIPELLERFGAPEGEGVRFVVSELRYMWATRPSRLPEVLVRNAAKYAGYRLGRVYTHLPHRVRVRMSMTKKYWNRESIPGR